MNKRTRQAEIVSDEAIPIRSGSAGFRRALLLSPPVYDAQYWSRWSQPAGLLRIATLLKQKGYHVDLLDCMETDAKGHVRKARRLVEGVPHVVVRDDVSKWIWQFGLGW